MGALYGCLCIMLTLTGFDRFRSIFFLYLGNLRWRDRFHLSPCRERLAFLNIFPLCDRLARDAMLYFYIRRSVAGLNRRVLEKVIPYELRSSRMVWTFIPSTQCLLTLVYEYRCLSYFNTYPSTSDLAIRNAYRHWLPQQQLVSVRETGIVSVKHFIVMSCKIILVPDC